MAQRTEHSLRIDEATARCRELQDMLTQQRVAYDMLLASRSNLEGECSATEQELKKLAVQLSKLVGVGACGVG